MIDRTLSCQDVNQQMIDRTIKDVNQQMIDRTIKDVNHQMIDIITCRQQMIDNGM